MDPTHPGIANAAVVAAIVGSEDPCAGRIAYLDRSDRSIAYLGRTEIACLDHLGRNIAYSGRIAYLGRIEIAYLDRMGTATTTSAYASLRTKIPVACTLRNRGLIGGV